MWGESTPTPQNWAAVPPPSRRERPRVGLEPARVRATRPRAASCSVLLWRLRDRDLRRTEQALVQPVARRVLVDDGACGLRGGLDVRDGLVVVRIEALTRRLDARHAE